MLTSLADGEKHAYAIAKDVEASAGVKMGPGTLYGALRRLQRDGLVGQVTGDERRYPYRMTNRGRAALSEHLGESIRIARLGLRRLALCNPERSCSKGTALSSDSK